ncbi:hypothetical protein AVEN_65623-1 [Araneus ventricosus]|uniref:Uncharacterized protein n=1 Tax=Araneus ventricosus TaxID=182803 RepID=A0A4Y2H177_ARAVE|nr:hypothetical protein AVEN_65623-1 [Araneus ventricosus]
MQRNSRNVDFPERRHFPDTPRTIIVENDDMVQFKLTPHAGRQALICNSTVRQDGFSPITHSILRCLRSGRHAEHSLISLVISRASRTQEQESRMKITNEKYIRRLHSYCLSKLSSFVAPREKKDSRGKRRARVFTATYFNLRRNRWMQ